MSNWITRIMHYENAIKDLEARDKACCDKERDKEKLKNEIKTLRNELKESEDLRKIQILEGQAVVQEKQEIIKKLHDDISVLKKEKTELVKKANSCINEIKSLRGQISSLTDEKAELEERVKFLKNNRRSPNMDELIQYTERRKRK